MGTGNRFARTWAVVGGGLAALVLVCALPFLVNDADTTDAILTNTVIALVGGAVIALMGGALLVWIWSDPHRRQVREIARTGWRTRAGGGGWRVRQGGRSKPSDYQRHEYRIRVLVERSDTPPYEAVVFQSLEERSVPKPGERIPVKVHRQRPGVVVLTGPDAPASS